MVSVFVFFLTTSAFAFPPAGSVNMDSIQHTKSLPTIQKLQLSIVTSKGDTVPTLTMIPGKSYDVPGTSFKVIASDFYCHWKIKGQPVNFSKEELNPAIRISVLKNDSLLYKRWAFKNSPYYGKTVMPGHNTSAGEQLYFTLVGYEGMAWPEEK